MFTVFLLLGLSITAVARAEPAETTRKPLYFSFITALTGESTSSGGIPIVDYAIEEINNNSKILSNYTLQYTKILDSKCSGTSALDAFLYQFDNESLTEPTYLSTVCCGCSPATIPVAEISSHWNIPHVSFASSSTSLNNRQRFRSIFRTLPCYIYIPHTIASLMNKFEWKQMAIISQDSSTFSRVSTGLESIFTRQGWLLKMVEFDPDSGTSYEETFAQIEEDHRIIMINTFENYAYHFVCEIFKRFGSRIMNHEVVIILHARFSAEWWETAHTRLNSTCSQQDVMAALNYSLTLTPDSYDILDNPNITTFSGMNSETFLKIYKEWLGRPEYDDHTPLDFIGSPYDAIWALAVALDMVDRWVHEGTAIDTHCDNSTLEGDFVSLDMFNYRNKKMGCLFHLAFSTVNFTGITGRVSFREEGSRPENVVRVRQHRIMKNSNHNFSVTRPTIGIVTNKDTYEAGVAIFVEEGRFYLAKNESSESLWPNLNGRSFPYDGSPRNAISSIPIGITASLYLLGIVGLIFTVVAFLFNLIFRNKRAVKLGSPNLNFLIILGSGLLFLDVFFVGSSVTDFNSITKETVLCNVRVWFFAVGYTLCLSVILAKQWRIYYIFSNPTPSKKIIKDWMLLIAVGVLLAVDVTILFIGTAIPDTRLIAQPTALDKLKTTENGLNKAVFILTCKQKKTDAWIAISYGYKALLQLGAMFMAFTTRKVKIRALNDTKETAVMIYLNSIIITALIVTEFSLSSHRDVCIALLGIALFLAGTLFLAVVFVPRAVFLALDPEGQTTTKQSSPNTYPSIHTAAAADHESPTISELKAQNALLQKKINKLQMSIENGKQIEQATENSNQNETEDGTENSNQNETKDGKQKETEHNG